MLLVRGSEAFAKKIGQNPINIAKPFNSGSALKLVTKPCAAAIPLAPDISARSVIEVVLVTSCENKKKRDLKQCFLSAKKGILTNL